MIITDSARIPVQEWFETRSKGMMGPGESLLVTLRHGVWEPLAGGAQAMVHRVHHRGTRTIVKRIREDKPLSPTEILLLAEQICHYAVALHRIGVPVATPIDIMPRENGKGWFLVTLDPDRGHN